MRRLACLTFLLSLSASAHPMGNFSVSHFTSIRVESDHVDLRFRIDFAEIPTAQELPLIDANHDGCLSAAETQSYLNTKLPKLTAAQSLKLNGQPLPLTATSSAIINRAGAGDLPTLLLTIDYRAPLPPVSGRATLEYSDDTYPNRKGWREIIATTSPAFRTIESTVPDTDRSHALEAYPPEDPFTPPPDDTVARLIFAPSGSTVAAATAPTTSPVATSSRNTSTPQDPFTRLITAEKLSAAVILTSLAVAFVLGSFHALSPGHGKTVVAAYLVGSRGTARHAMLLGAVVTLTHVAGVFALGFIVLFASKYILPETLFPWLGFTSGLMIVAIGLWQFTRRYALMYAARRAQDPTTWTFAPLTTAQPGTAGLRPAPPPSFHVHPPGFHDHHHGPGGHSHDLPDRITPGSLIALGVSGGIVPCPSALIVLLSAIALHRTGFGLVLITAFSFGLASVLILIGLLMLYARHLLNRFSFTAAPLQKLPLISPLVVAFLGAAIAVQALVSGGILSLKLGA